MITAIWNETEVEILDTTAVGLAEIITLDGSRPFRIVSSSKAREHGALPIVWLTSGYVDIDELSNVQVEETEAEAEAYMAELYGDHMPMRALRMAGEELPF